MLLQRAKDKPQFFGALGSAVALGDANVHLVGVCLLSDGSARDIQGWGMLRPGPLQAKKFAASVSPWIVTIKALAPYRTAWQRDAAFAQPLAYLDTAAKRRHGALDIQLQLGIESQNLAGCATWPC